MSAAAPCLRSDLTFIEQQYGGETSYVVKDRAAQRFFRFGQTEVRVMRAFDGRHTPQELAIVLTEHGIRLSARAIERFARKLAEVGFLERTMSERTTLQMERLRAERRTRRRLFRGELLRMRWSFGDPNALLERTLPFIRWMFTPAFLAASVVLFALYLIVLGQRWPAYAAALQSTYSPHTISVWNVAVLLVTGLVVVLIHELGHAYTCAYFGGEVRELGFMLLYFQPAFYCNVSDAWGFPDRGARLWVTAAGSWIQLVVAALAAIVWWAAAPGTLLAEVCAAAMLVGGVMTLLTNMNPLLPLDGYFALSDWLEIPNLRQRASEHIGWWLQRVLFRLELSEPAASPRERRVFLIYGALSAAYIGLTFALVAAFVFGRVQQAFGGVGVLIATAGLLLLMRNPLIVWSRRAALAVHAHRAAPRRRLGSTRAIVLLFGVLISEFVIPWTLTSPGTFVVQPANSRIITSADTAVVAEVLVSEGLPVLAGAPIVRLIDRSMDRELLQVIRTADAFVVAEAAVRSAGRASDADALAASRRATRSQLTALERRLRRLTLRAPIAGLVLTRRPEELVGRLVLPGDSLLVLGAPDSVDVRIALANAGAAQVRVGQVVHLISYADAGAPWTGRVSDVTRVGVDAGGVRGVIEARVRRASGDAWRPGVRGEASVELERSTLFGALLWNVRQWVRTDLWL